jgi:hypothetical protein
MIQSQSVSVSLKPGDFRLRSNRSRAAARAMLAGRQGTLERREIIICSDSESSSPQATDWIEDAKERTMGRVVSIPEGMTLAEGLLALGGYSEGEIAHAAEIYPNPVNVGTMLMVQR